MLTSGIEIEAHGPRGDAAAAILSVAEENKADLIILGSKGMQGARRVLGSVPNKVSHKAPCDLLIVEGFKHAAIPKLEVWRAVTGEGLLHPQDPHIVAVASDCELETALPRFALDDDAAIAEFIVRHLKLA